LNANAITGYGFGKNWVAFLKIDEIGEYLDVSDTKDVISLLETKDVENLSKKSRIKKNERWFDDDNLLKLLGVPKGTCTELRKP
jgi:hypothetical protein